MEQEFMRQAIELSLINVRNGGGPFGAVVAKGERLIASGTNQVTSTNDPSAHAEIVAIRSACRELGSFQLTGCELYTSCEPCPMCLGAIYWARLDRIYFANSRREAAAAGFDDEFIYSEMPLPGELRRIPAIRIPREEAREAFAAWDALLQKTCY